MPINLAYHSNILKSYNGSLTGKMAQIEKRQSTYALDWIICCQTCCMSMYDNNATVTLILMLSCIIYATITMILTNPCVICTIVTLKPMLSAQPISEYLHCPTMVRPSVVRRSLSFPLAYISRWMSFSTYPISLWITVLCDPTLSASTLG